MEGIYSENVGLASSECPHQEISMNLESPLSGSPSVPTCTQDERLGHGIVTPLLFDILSILLVYQIQASRNRVPSAMKSILSLGERGSLELVLQWGLITSRSPCFLVFPALGRLAPRA